MPEPPAHLLLVDDEAELRAVLAARLVEHGFEVAEAESGERALELLNKFAFDIVVSDLRLPGIDGRRVIDSAIERYPGIIAIVITGYGTVKDAVEALKRGATDFVAKPFQFDELLHVLGTALEQRRLKNENAYLRQQLDERFGLGAMIGQSPRMRALFQLIETVAPTSTTILINGETGTGKEMVARAIHLASPRRQQRFIALNCSAIPETLLEAELFGHVRGAFTGAVSARQGRIEQADRGTLFLDEVGTMSMPIQMKLLRVLQEREFERIGDGKPVKVDVRVVAATNADLARMVKEGSFREDLYYRLNVIQIELPPLRDRRDDIPLLVQHFVGKFASRVGNRESGVSTPNAESRIPNPQSQLPTPDIRPSTPDIRPSTPDIRPSTPDTRPSTPDTRPSTPDLRLPLVSQEALRRLMAYYWPGNVRQLENAIERAIALLGGRSTIEVSDLPPEIQAAQLPVTPSLDFPDAGVDLPVLVEQIERDLIRRALSRTGGNKAAAAGLLKLKRTTLVEKLKRLPGLMH